MRRKRDFLTSDDKIVSIDLDTEVIKFPECQMNIDNLKCFLDFVKEAKKLRDSYLFHLYHFRRDEYEREVSGFLS